MQTIRTIVLGVGAPMLLTFFGVQVGGSADAGLGEAPAVPAAKGGNGGGNGGGGNGGGGNGATCADDPCPPDTTCVDTPSGAQCLLIQPITCATLDCAPGYVCVDTPTGATCVPL